MGFPIRRRPSRLRTGSRFSQVTPSSPPQPSQGFPRRRRKVDCHHACRDAPAGLPLAIMPRRGRAHARQRIRFDVQSHNARCAMLDAANPITRSSLTHPSASLSPGGAAAQQRPVQMKTTTGLGLLEVCGYGGVQLCGLMGLFCRRVHKPGAWPSAAITRGTTSSSFVAHPSAQPTARQPYRTPLLDIDFHGSFFRVPARFQRTSSQKPNPAARPAQRPPSEEGLVIRLD